ncbi:hypothetical protein [Nostoc sp.]|uniref:hypothetical protein n=1 Tax=Nostoc sp. TaxID=1180 RepID=UPI002FF7E45D
MNDSYKTTRSLLSIPINDTLITNPTAIAIDQCGGKLKIRCLMLKKKLAPSP